MQKRRGCNRATAALGMKGQRYCKFKGKQDRHCARQGADREDQVDMLQAEDDRRDHRGGLEPGYAPQTAEDKTVVDDLYGDPVDQNDPMQERWPIGVHGKT